MGLPSGLFPSGFSTKTLYTPLLSPIRATCPAHLILLDLITRTTFGEKVWTQLFRIFVFCNSFEFRDTTLNYRMMWCRADVVHLLYRRYLVRISPNTGCSNRLYRGFPQWHDTRHTCIRSQSLPSKSSPFHHLWWIRGISYSPDGCSIFHRIVGRFLPD
jgi:hypothetical protein